MMSSSVLLIQTGDKVEPPFKPSMNLVFSPQIISNKKNIHKDNNNNNSTMTKAHNKSEEQLKKMKVSELKALVKKHNLHNQIKGYATMKKAQLVAALMLHAKGAGGSSTDIPPPKKGRGRPKKTQDAGEPTKKVGTFGKLKKRYQVESVMEESESKPKRGRGRPKRM